MEGLRDTAIEAAIEAGQAILEIYHSGDFDVTTKGDDSPLTKADLASHDVIMRHLEPTGIPVLSEEGRDMPFAERSAWSELWIVDPIDGTKEFIKRNGEFTVNIALIENLSPTMGVVFAPALDTSYAANGPGTAVRRIGKQTPQSIAARRIPDQSVIATASRSHGDKDKMQALLKDFAIGDVVVSGSSVKFCIVACGEADIYPRYGPTCEWDIAAGHAVLNAAGGSVCTLDGNDMRYGKPKFLNPEFIAYGNRG